MARSLQQILYISMFCVGIVSTLAAEETVPVANTGEPESMSTTSELANSESTSPVDSDSTATESSKTTSGFDDFFSGMDSGNPSEPTSSKVDEAAELSHWESTVSLGVTPMFLVNRQREQLKTDGSIDDNSYKLFNLFLSPSLTIGYSFMPGFFLGGSVGFNLTDQVFNDFKDLENNFSGAVSRKVDLLAHIYPTEKIRIQPTFGLNAGRGTQPTAPGASSSLKAATLFTDGAATTETSQNMTGGVSVGMRNESGRLNLVGNYNYKLTHIDREASNPSGNVGNRRDHDQTIGLALYHENYLGTVKFLMGVYTGYRYWKSNYVYGNNAGYDAALRGRLDFSKKVNVDLTYSFAYRQYYHRKDSRRFNNTLDLNVKWFALDWLILSAGANASVLRGSNISILGDNLINGKGTESKLDSLNFVLTATLNWGIKSADEKRKWIADDIPCGAGGGVTVGGGVSCSGGSVLANVIQGNLTHS